MKTLGNIKHIILQELADYEKMPNGPEIDYKSEIYILLYIMTVIYFIMLWNIFKIISYDEKFLALERDGFEGQPLYFCNVATSDEKIIGYTLSYYTYSTWCGKSMYLEDIYVTPDFRGKHVGSKLLKAVAKVYVQLE